MADDDSNQKSKKLDTKTLELQFGLSFQIIFLYITRPGDRSGCVASCLKGSCQRWMDARFWFGLNLKSLMGKKNQTKTRGNNAASLSAMTKVTAHFCF